MQSTLTFFYGRSYDTEHLLQINFKTMGVFFYFGGHNTVAVCLLL